MNQGNGQSLLLQAILGPGLSFLNTVVQLPIQLGINIFV
jgi:hypothetical protein